MNEKFNMQNARHVADNGDLIHTTKTLYAALDRVVELEAILKDRGAEIDRDREVIEHLEKHARAYLDLQQVCDDQAKRIAELEAENARLRSPNACDDLGNPLVLSVSGGSLDNHAEGEG